MLFMSKRKKPNEKIKEINISMCIQCNVSTLKAISVY